MQRSFRGAVVSCMSAWWLSRWADDRSACFLIMFLGAKQGLIVKIVAPWEGEGIIGVNSDFLICPPFTDARCRHGAEMMPARLYHHLDVPSQLWSIVGRHAVVCFRGRVQLIRPSSCLSSVVYQ